MRAYECTDVAAPAELVIKALRADLQSRGITEYALVDHGHDMAAASVTAHPAWTLIFGNPAAGEAVLAVDLWAAVDIPLRLAVIALGEDHSQIVMRPMDSLLGPELAPVAARLTGVLRAVVEAAANSAARRV